VNDTVTRRCAAKEESMFRSVICGLLLTQAIGLASVAQATTLFTPPGTVPANHYARGEIVNVGTSTVQVTKNAVMAMASGGEITLQNSCTTLEPGKGCGSFIFSNFSNTVYCRFVVTSSRVRAVLTITDPQGYPIASIPANAK
jgi:hypothetical protein